MTGTLTVIGLGPGPAGWVTPAASVALAESTDLVGYKPYLDRIPDGAQRKHASDNRVEVNRAQHALELVASGKNVAVVSGGDPGVFAMAAAVLEAVEAGPAEWRTLDIRFEPGVTAMLAAAARVGAPLGHDFAGLSLSDNLKPWDVVQRRLRLAAEADFVLALYNPVSKARPWQLAAAFETLLSVRDAATPVVFARAVGRPDERIAIVELRDAAKQEADMATLVIVGSSQTRLIVRGEGQRPWVLTPRSYAAT